MIFYNKSVIQEIPVILKGFEALLLEKGFQLKYTEEGIKELSTALSTWYFDKIIAINFLTKYTLELIVYIGEVYIRTHHAKWVLINNSPDNYLQLAIEPKKGEYSVSWVAILYDVIEDLPYVDYLELLAPYSSIGRK